KIKRSRYSSDEMSTCEERSTQGPNVHPCRVAFVIENAPFEQDRRVRKEAAALRTIGCEVSVISPKGTSQKHAFVEVVDGVRAYTYWQPWNGGGVVGYMLEYSWA